MQAEQLGQLSFDGVELPATERFSFDPRSRLLSRFVLKKDGSEAVSTVISGSAAVSSDLSAEFDLAWLKSRTRPAFPEDSSEDEMRVADLFSGCGGMSLGLQEAGRAVGQRLNFVFACDIDSAALDVYRENFRPDVLYSDPIEKLVDGEPGMPPTKSEKALVAELGAVDVVLAGPPCQGHSDLNNHTRRNDPKNQLVVRVARFVELFRPSWVLIENVPGIRHDRKGVLSVAKEALAQIGYGLNEGLLSADQLGAPQRRKRFFLVASRDEAPNLLPSHFQVLQSRSAGWALGDLVSVKSNTVFNTSAKPSAENLRRINYLFDHGLYELPDAQRPPCHRDKKHSYKSVYGRMYWDQPAQTITTGFGSTGQGRFVHPTERRTLTPHEAARLQFFPDFFDFGVRGRRQYQSLIGNAVPSKLAYSIALEQLR